MDGKILERYQRWEEKATADADVAEQLRQIAGNKEAIEDAFYRDLSFGTGGLRGVIGAGTNRMNVHTVARASQGLANYVIKHFPPEQRKIAVSYDSRIKSDLFAQIASGVFAANEIQVFIYPCLMPTPCLSFAVRAIGCAAGVMITASHNPAQYNGYKVYGPDGCQITDEAAKAILGEIVSLDYFTDVNAIDFQTAVQNGMVRYIDEDVYDAFVEKTKELSVLYGAPAKKDISIVYSPLNGTGLRPVLRVLREAGYNNITVVREQEQPDGHFPTCPYPNPEIKETMTLGLEYARRQKAALLLATDPDCDRVGVAVRDRMGEYVLLSGNEVGMLLLDYICSRRTAGRTMPSSPVAVKTIVTTDMAEKIASHYGVRMINVLTGFKYIGEQIGRLEAAKKEDNYVFGFEESCGYLSGTHVRDKDAVNAALLICEMAAYYASQGAGLLDRLNELYETYGYCLNTLHTYEFPGSVGMAQIQRIMRSLRNEVDTIGEEKVVERLDYAAGVNGLPKADVIKFVLEDGGSVVVRPSGTEPKLKMYISVTAEEQRKAEVLESVVAEDLFNKFR